MTSASIPDRTQVAIVGGGPAGLLLSHLLHAGGVSSVVLESRPRERVESRQRAGILEHGTVDVLREVGAGERMDREGLVHDGFELRFSGRGVRIDMQALTGRNVMIYAQTEVVKDLIALRLEQGEPLLFDAEVTEVTDVDTGSGGPGSGGPVSGGLASGGPGSGGPGSGGPGSDAGVARVRYRHDGVDQVLHADVVVGADGFHGVARRAIPAEAVRTYERVYPFSWLGILADVAPSTEELIYARHERGFALHSMRSPSVSRLYLQVPNGTDAADWSDEEIWDELAARFALADGSFTLERGPITEKSVTPMRSFVAEPMRHGRLFLVGDAAHIVPPTGAKGLNLAVADVRRLAPALTEFFTAEDETLLDAYSDAALARVWRAEHFSWTMTTLTHPDPDADPFDDQLALSHLRLIASSESAATTVAENYRGLALDDA